MIRCPQCGEGYPEGTRACARDGAHLGATEPPAPDPLIGTTIDGRYVVETVLGQGGMGSVYGARHAIIDKQVALKVLRRDLARADEAAAQRFLGEARAASKIGQQNIVDITDFGMLPDGRAYFAMEFLSGPTLGKLLSGGQPLTPRRAARIAIQIAQGLAAAHDKQIVHRDLKPENIFVLEREGQKDLIKLVDFGIARDQTHQKRLTMAGVVLGTPEYIAPEQAIGAKTDHRVDLYALGCILYEMLTGDVPFRGDTPTKTLTMHVYDALVPPSVRRPELRIPSTLEAVAVRALAKRPEARQADARTLKAELEAALRELEAPAVHAARMPTQPSLQRVARRRRAITGAAVAVIAVLAAGAAWVRRQPTRVPAVTSSAGLEARVTASAIDPREAAGLAPAASAPRPNEVRLAFTSTPQGAQVFEGQELLGSCPLSLSRPRELGHVVLTFRHPGYRDEIRDITTDSPKDVFVVLAKRPQPKRPRPTRGMRPSARGQASDLRNPFE